ncbi:hypothetical protein P7C70_g4637, partial [Phenoliferia sp. Uapishka_3]
MALASVKPDPLASINALPSSIWPTTPTDQNSSNPMPYKHHVPSFDSRHPYYSHSSAHLPSPNGRTPPPPAGKQPQGVDNPNDRRVIPITRPKLDLPPSRDGRFDLLHRRGSVDSLADSPSQYSESAASTSSLDPEVIPVIATRPASLKRPSRSDHGGGRLSPADRLLFEGPIPTVYATMWEDEWTFCYQVCRDGHVVSRRVDNDYINCTKMVNMLGLSRGRRDMILKKEPIKEIVRQGSMQLKGVWVPFAPARKIAESHGLLEKLSPLFDEDIEDQLYSPESIGRTVCLVDATRQRQRQLEDEQRRASFNGSAASTRPFSVTKYTAMLAFLDKIDARVRDTEPALVAKANAASRDAFGMRLASQAPRDSFTLKPPTGIWSYEPPPIPSHPLSKKGGTRPQQGPPTPSSSLASFSFGNSYTTDEEQSSTAMPSPVEPPRQSQSQPAPTIPTSLPSSSFDRRHSHPSTSYQPSFGYGQSLAPPRRYSTIPQYPTPSSNINYWGPSHPLDQSIVENQQSSFAYSYYPTPSNSTESFSSLAPDLTRESLSPPSSLSSSLPPTTAYYPSYDPPAGRNTYPPLYHNKNQHYDPNLSHSHAEHTTYSWPEEATSYSSHMPSATPAFAFGFAGGYDEWEAPSEHPDQTGEGKAAPGGVGGRRDSLIGAVLDPLPDQGEEESKAGSKYYHDLADHNAKNSMTWEGTDRRWSVDDGARFGRNEDAGRR